jgi:orotidine 5'-phosphate decarboxylase subfamily 2
VAAHGSVGRVVTAGAVGRRPTSGCTGRRASTLFRSFERRRAAPVNLGVGRGTRDRHMTSSENYFGKLRAASAKRDSLLCVGLDPEPRVIGAGVETAIEFCRRLIDRTSDIACCYKPNAAFWEQYGPKGWEALSTIRSLVPSDVPVLLDCKRADVPNTMAAYAAAVFDAMQFDAATVHAYHGMDSLSVFAEYTTRGVYVVCHTSNPGRVDLQHLQCGKQPLFMDVAELAMDCAKTENVGLVIGATAPREVALVRQRFTQCPFLLPGVGRQGGDVESTVRAAFNGDPASCLIGVAGAIMYADDPRTAAASWRDRIRAAADGKPRYT